jgi:hypothetical protein
MKEYRGELPALMVPGDRLRLLIIFIPGTWYEAELLALTSVPNRYQTPPVIKSGVA